MSKLPTASTMNATLATTTLSRAPVFMLTKNNLQLTRQAVTTAITQELVSFLMIYDDGSTDGTIEYLRSLSLPEWYGARYYQAQGVSKLWNQGLSYLFSSPGIDRVLVINNDVKLRPDTIRVLSEDGSPFVAAVGVNQPGQFPGGTPTRVRRPHPDFSCFLLRRECWERVGKFDESMKIYCSDLDYHIRMHRAGIEAVSIDLPFWHHVSATLKLAEPDEHMRICRQADLDRVAFRAKWGVAAGSPEYYDLFKSGGTTK